MAPDIVPIRSGSAGPTSRSSTSTCPDSTASPRRRNCTMQLPSCRTLIVTNLARAGTLRRALAAHVSGYMLKDAPPEQLTDAIRNVAAGPQGHRPAAGAWPCGTAGRIRCRHASTRFSGSPPEGAGPDGDRDGAAPVGRNGAQLPDDDRDQAERAQPGRRDQDRVRRGLAAVVRAAQLRTLCAQGLASPTAAPASCCA